MSFDTQYQQLNTAQKQAVDTIEGPVLVLAGPGTGKTHVLTLRIANILRQTDVNPGNILALTFTDSAAQTMRERLVTLIGAPGYGVQIETFHALADTLIRTYPEFFTFTQAATPISQLEQYNLLRSLLDNPDLHFLRTPGSKYHYIRDLISAISTLKRENITSEKFRQVVTDEQQWLTVTQASLKKAELLKWEALIGKHTELTSIYAAYQEKLQQMAHYDFDDMLLSTLTALASSPLLLTTLQEQFQFFLVDEYQDTNGVQNAIVDTLAAFWGEAANLFVVGDPNQTIFRFQGAALANTLGFLDRYPKAAVINLNIGYRSNQQIYAAAHQLITPVLNTLVNHPLAAPLSTPLTATHTRGTLTVTQAATDTDELLWLVSQIRTLIGLGINPCEIAVLCKRNADLTTLADLFERANLPFHTERPHDVLADPCLQQFFTLLRLLSSLTTTTEHRLLFDCLGFAWFSPFPQETSLSALNLLELIRSFTTQKTVTTPFEFIMQTATHLHSLTHLKDLDAATIATLHQLGSLLATWVNQERQITFPEFVQLVLHESGFLTFLETHPEHSATLQNCVTLLRAIKQLAHNPTSYHLDDFLTYLTTMTEHQLTLTRDSENNAAGVTLATVHKAKGREWQHVFIPFFKAGYWGNLRNKTGLALPQGILTHAQAFEPEHDERRLLFVALTRAKETLHFSFAGSDQENERLRINLPSPYLTELLKTGQTQIATFDPELQRLFLTPIATQVFDTQTEQWLKSLTANFRLSASALNAYLEDPHLFFERYLLKLPEATQSHLAYGTAIHAALEHYYRLYQTSDHAHPSLSLVLPVFETVLKSQTLTPNDLVTRLVQGRATLTAYLDEQRATFPEILALEESFGWRRGPINLGDISLTGKIDRIDVLDGEAHCVRVIDYKTGKPKTLGDIEGTTKASDLSTREQQLPPSIRGRLKRQLLFYKLLLQLDPKYKHFHLEDGAFMFVEPQREAFTTRIVALSESDLETLKALIRDVMRDIRSLKF